VHAVLDELELELEWLDEDSEADIDDDSDWLDDSDDEADTELWAEWLELVPSEDDVACELDEPVGWEFECELLLSAPGFVLDELSLLPHPTRTAPTAISNEG
jgi:hypothetical protein